MENDRHLIPAMLKKLLLQDALRLWILLTACLLGGIIINEIRPAPLPLVYSSRKARVNHAVEKLTSEPTAPVAPEGDVRLDEMRQISAQHAALILDARPEIFYRVGHIPSALSLPRDDFENQYRAMEPALRRHRDQTVIVYCSSRDCEDSQLVGDALAHLGYVHVRLFRGGWSDWENGNLPEEKE